MRAKWIIGLSLIVAFASCKKEKEREMLCEVELNASLTSDSTATIDVFAVSPSGHDITEIGFTGEQGDSKKNLSVKGGTYSFNINNLVAGLGYSFEPFAIIGNVMRFTGDQQTIQVPLPENISLVSIVSEESFESASIWVQYTLSNTTSTVTEVGISSNQFSISPEPVANQTTGQANFSIVGLTENSNYTYAPYIIIDGSYYYGDSVTFNTKSYADEVDVYAIMLSINLESAIIAVNFNVSNTVGSINEVGVLSNDFVLSPYTGLNQSNGQLNFPVNGLTQGTTYSILPYAVINGVHCYGDSLEFTTADLPDFGPAGGYVFYDDGNGGGMEVVINYIQSDWGCLGQSIPTLSSLGSGQNNTSSIIMNCSSTTNFASQCDNFSYGGYDDWFMPSRDELIKIYESIYALYPGLIDDNVYVSSSEGSSDMALSVVFDANSYTNSQMWKDANIFYTLPVRSF